LGSGEKGKEEVGKSFPLSPFFFSPSFSFLYVGGGGVECTNEQHANKQKSETKQKITEHKKKNQAIHTNNNICTHVLFLNWRKSGRWGNFFFLSFMYFIHTQK